YISQDFVARSGTISFSPKIQRTWDCSKTDSEGEMLGYLTPDQLGTRAAKLRTPSSDVSGLIGVILSEVVTDNYWYERTLENRATPIEGYYDVWSGAVVLLCLQRRSNQRA
ncbi:hypothetical protein MKX03_015737, partial [Papaver bracteatum]